MYLRAETIADADLSIELHAEARYSFCSNYF